MTTVLLIRHGLTALTESTLVGLDPGRPPRRPRVAQAERPASGSGASRSTAIVSSPIDRCRETAAIVASVRDPIPERSTSTTASPTSTTATGPGGPFKELHREPLWKTVPPTRPWSRFPNGEAAPRDGDPGGGRRP